MITMVGNLVRDPETRNTAGGSLTKLRLASNDRIKDANGDWTDGPTTFIDVSCWRRLADGAATLHKGDRVIVQGKLKGREYDKNDGTKAYAYEIDASEIGVTVFGRTSTAVRAERPVSDEESAWD